MLFRSGPNDVVSFALYGHPDLARANVLIGPDGRVSYLQAQGITAAGLTIDELRETVAREFASPMPAASRRSAAKNCSTRPASAATLSGMQTPDQWRELFRMQRALNERIGVFTDRMDEAEKTKWILN